VVAPLARDGQTLHFHGGYRYAVFPRRGGRWPELGTTTEREWVGRFLGRIHAVGRAADFRERPVLSIGDLGRGARDFVLEGGWMPDYLADKYADLTDVLLEEVEDRARGWRGTATGRILGDCHRGNILWTDLGPHFVDLDDCVTGPAIQDLWMLIAGGREEMAVELADLLKGYEQFLPFNRRELALIEPLRALRMIHYSAWLARRWHDPAFPQAFPWFAEPRYWEEHYRALEDQLAQVQEPPLEL
jgi:Ser/Thr protein kinase RdoA (MazF antagonist)